MVKDCKSVFLREFLWPIFFPWVIDFVVSDEWILRSSKPCMARVFAGVPFLCCLFSAFFNLQQAMGDQRTKMAFDLQCTLKGHFVLSCTFCTS
jgi:hypothetical protein